MEIVRVSGVLAAQGLQAPTINALVPNIDNYQVLLMQPAGFIEASAAGVHNRDRDLARQQFSEFLATVAETNVDLAVTPEYSMPWDVLVQAVKDGMRPKPGKLWAFGCESITFEKLCALRSDLEAGAVLICESLEVIADRFVDPLVYLFLASPTDGGASRLVMLVQFKTHPMGDADHFELNALQRGKCIYQFGEVGHSVRLLSLICSDAFAFFDQDAYAVYDRSLVLHIQLNPKPRHQQYRLYRERLLKFEGDATELICLNWARDVREWCPDDEKSWKNIAASAWYLKPNKHFDQRDATLSGNHRLGLYYTWLKPLRVHALFFNYNPAIYLITATKVAHIGVVTVLSRRRGPQLTRRLDWDAEAANWTDNGDADDEFAPLAAESRGARGEIIRLHGENPYATERVLALCAGMIGYQDSWHDVCTLDSCSIEESEIVRRITFCQDIDPGASAFRVARLRRCGQLWDVVANRSKLPPAVADLAEGYRLEWLSDFPHQNAISNQGRRATLIHMGEDAAYVEIEAVAKRVAEFLHRSCSNPHDSLADRQRVAVWFRNNEGQIVSLPMDRYLSIDKTGDASEFDIGREQ